MDVEKIQRSGGKEEENEKEKKHELRSVVALVTITEGRKDSG